MQSNGGLAAAESFHAMSSVLSGPAGGLIGMHWVGERLGEQRLIGFDMGGTSTDVSLVDGELPQRFEHLIAGARLNQPMLDVHSIAAGGGSILSYHDGRFAVGPASAGADPGPVCYGRGGPLTLTDVQVLLGHLRTDTLPAVFGPEGRSPIDAQKVTAAFATVARELREPGARPAAAGPVLARPLHEAGPAPARTALDELESEARAELTPGGADGARVRIARLLEVRAGDSDVALSVPLAGLGELREAFHAEHLRRFGFSARALEAVIESLRVEARLASVDAATLVMPEPAAAGELPQRVRAWFGGWREVPLVPMGALRAELEGPALIVEAHSTVVLEEGWRARRLPGGELLLEESGARRRPRVAAAADPARIEIFNNLFMHIAEQMGEVLRSTAQSVNIRERLDYSCALFDGDGGLVANAPHMPVHLGSMGASVRSVIAAQQARLRPGDSWLLNSPYHGGTHLPDMTVVTPVFVGGQARPDFFVASRAHHADIGGVTPGSMPPFSRAIEEEGALFECFALVSAGTLRESELRAALTAGPWPARRPEQNLADLRAQLAANARGIAEIGRAVRRHGP